MGMLEEKLSGRRLKRRPMATLITVMMARALVAPASTCGGGAG